MLNTPKRVKILPTYLRLIFSKSTDTLRLQPCRSVKLARLLHIIYCTQSEVIRVLQPIDLSDHTRGLKTMKTPQQRLLFWHLHTALRLRSKYTFYDLVCDTPSHPQQPLEASMMTAEQLEQLKQTTSTRYEGSYSVSNLTAEQKMARVFGGRIKGESPKSSSRLTRGKPKVIAGISVPDRPPEPDNCCMSGCINCVWELFNEDIKDWNSKRKLAAQKLQERGGRWPENFHAPVRYLKDENLPLSLAQQAESVRKKTEKSSEEAESWGNVPVSIRVFADFEKKMSQRKRKQA